MRVLAALTLALMLAPLGQAAEPTVLAVFQLSGLHVAGAPAGPTEDPMLAERVTFAAFQAPEGAAFIRVELTTIHRTVVEVRSFFDVYLDSPSGVSRAILGAGLAPANVGACFPPAYSCEFAGDASATLPAEPGEWSLSYRGVFHGDHTYTAFAIE